VRRTPTPRVPLSRALSKLGILSRRQATAAILDGRVRVDGRIVRDPARLVVPERIRLDVDGQARERRAWRTIVVHKPRGVLTTRSDPEGRRTIYDVLGEVAEGLVPVGRLDLATSGLIILTNDTRLADRLADPTSAVPRVYVVTVRGRVGDAERIRLLDGVRSRGEDLRASDVRLRKVSARESHLVVELREGKNREVRRLLDAIGHEVTRLKRVRFGSLEIGDLEPGEWRDVSRAEIAAALGSS